MRTMRWLFSGAQIQSVSANVGLVFLRAFTGLSLAFAHGIGKLPPSERFVESVARMGFPLAEWFAWAAGLAEFVGGLCLAVGLLTRPASLFIVITMVVAAFLRHADDPFATKEKALLFGCVAFAFLWIGSGKYSLDAVLRSKRQK